MFNVVLCHLYFIIYGAGLTTFEKSLRLYLGRFCFLRQENFYEFIVSIASNIKIPYFFLI